MNIAAIDPGKAGGLAFVYGDHYNALAMPLAGKEIDAVEVTRVLSAWMPAVVVIEKAQAMPGQGVTSMFNYGTGFGLLLGICAALDIPVRLVTPQAWKKVVLAGTPKDKDAAIAFVRRAYPHVNLAPGRKRKPHDGMADAMCIAEYGRQLMVKGAA